VNWVAIIPLKQGDGQKSRLADALSKAERDTLMESLFRHVLGQLEAATEIHRVILLSPRRPTPCGIEWCPDLGRGLNAELDDLRAQLARQDVMVVHGDLPLLRASDISRLASEAERVGVAIAPDRHGTGTNAIALRRGVPFRFAFGEGSFRRHSAFAPHAAIIVRPGLSHDLDTPHDLDVWLSCAGRADSRPPGAWPGTRSPPA